MPESRRLPGFDVVRKVCRLSVEFQVRYSLGKHNDGEGKNAKGSIVLEKRYDASDPLWPGDVIFFKDGAHAK
jgi:hypothetical protein